MKEEISMVVDILRKRNIYFNKNQKTLKTSKQKLLQKQ
jgi:hypothetical protein